MVAGDKCQHSQFHDRARNRINIDHNAHDMRPAIVNTGDSAHSRKGIHSMRGDPCGARGAGARALAGHMGKARDRGANPFSFRANRVPPPPRFVFRVGARAR